METIQHLWLYFLLVAGIILVPGMDMLFVLASALVGGRRAGLAATSGIMLGGACHTTIGLLAVALLSALVPALFTPMLVVGSLYMLWVGYGLARSAITVDGTSGTGPERSRSEGRIFLQGLATSLLNPKAWLFVLAVFPQFIRPDLGPLLPQAAALGVITVLAQGAIYGAVALGALRARRALITNPAATTWVGRGAGILLMVVAAFTLSEALRPA